MKHLNDEELIACLYGIENGHVQKCAHCAERLSAMRQRRRMLEAEHASGEDVPFDFLAAQRRGVYEKLERRSNGWQFGQLRRYVSAAAAVLVLAGGIAVFESAHKSNNSAGDKISDAQLVSDVSQFADNSEPAATAPIQALFEE